MASNDAIRIGGRDATVKHAANQLDDAHGSSLGAPESGEGVVRASVSINAEYCFEGDHIAATTSQSLGTLQHLKARRDPTISSVSTSTSISVQARDVQLVPGSSSTPSPPFDPFRRPSIPDAPGAAQTLKHPRSQIALEPPLKKRRPELQRRHTLGPESYPEGLASLYRPSSPPLPSPPKEKDDAVSPSPRPSTAHAIAAIRNKIREDSGGITTLKLARGYLGNGSAQRSSNNMVGNLVSVEERAATPLDPETTGTLTGMELLGNVGVVELLEQDERPTFIIDVANPANYTPGGPLQIVFANASLRAHEVSFVFPGHIFAWFR